MNYEEEFRGRLTEMFLKESLIPVGIMFVIWLAVGLTRRFYSDEERFYFLMACAFVFALFPLPLMKGFSPLYDFVRMVHFTCGLSLGYLAFRQEGLKGLKTMSRERRRFLVYGLLFLLCCFLASLPMALF
ncbi:MAG: hypothetical protein ACSHX6_10905 [Akkermansiaceae bacterium]